jgi:hypothetical protein
MNFEKENQAPDQEGGIEELEYGKFSVTPEDRKRITDEAIKRGGDPERAIQAFAKRMQQATARLREAQAKEAIKKLEEHLSKALKNQEEEKGEST